MISFQIDLTCFIRFANEYIKPLSAEMDEKAQMNPVLLQQLFEQGLMSVHVPLEFGGSGMGFTQVLQIYNYQSCLPSFSSHIS